MKRSQNQQGSSKVKNGAVAGATSNRFLPNSLRFISSCIKTVSSNVRSAGASVASSISADSNDLRKDQVLWACFDRLEVGPSFSKQVLLIGYSNGFQVLDVEDASNVCELVSRRDDPVTFLQMQPIPAVSNGSEGYKKSHPLLLVVASEEAVSSNSVQNRGDGSTDPHAGNLAFSPTAVRFYSLRSHSYVHVLRFRSTVYMIRCSPQIVAVGLASQIYCFDALTLENKFSVLTYPVPQLGGQGIAGVNIGYGPMAVGSRWLAYASNNPLISNTGRLSPQSLSPPGVSPSTSPSSGNMVARYAMESSKHLATGLINLGDMGYKTLSKYYQELVPDGSSSPTSTTANWKVGRVAAHSSEADAAGTVVIKDIVSRAVISQFRAHTSPLSALCFDPSGTLLVTASTRGNNINVFRIMPSCSQGGSGTRTYHWASSHVHLYKLHRGMIPAVIQDICFSHYSQWIAIVSSRGTCHIFVLSPFGGESGLQLQHSHVDGPTLVPAPSVPWWATSSLMCQFLPPSAPPATVTLSVISRIKNGNGWLNTVNNAAASVAGKVSIPSGVSATVFHNSIFHNLPTAPSHVANALEHLLVFSPSGYLVQYELTPSGAREQVDSSLRNVAVTSVQLQDDELSVKVEPVQWWDVCRRSDWPEREECVQGITIGGGEDPETVMDTSASGDVNTGEKVYLNPHDQSHWYLSNAEVQLQSGRKPIWQKSKIFFYTMNLPQYEELSHSKDSAGEVEIEKVPAQEVDIRHKDLLPVFDHFHRIDSNWRCGSGMEKSNDLVTSHLKTLIPGSMGNSRAVSPGVHGRDNLQCHPRNDLFLDEDTGVRSGGSNTTEIQSSTSAVTSEGSSSSSNRSDTSMNIVDEGPMHEDFSTPVDFGQYFKEGYCKVSKEKESCEMAEVVEEDVSRDKEKHEDAESDDMLGGVFAFSEEG